MKKLTRLKIGPAALLVLLALLTLLVVKRKDLTAEKAEDDGVRAAVKVKDRVIRDERGAVAFLVLMALLAFVTWAALRANEGEDEATPPPGDSHAGASRP